MSVAQRAAEAGAALAAAAALTVLALGRPGAALVLTATAAVGMINGLWLEGALARILHPGQPRLSLRAVLQLAGRWALWLALFAVFWAVQEHVDVWAVVPGVLCHLAALAWAGLGEEAGTGPAER